MFMKEFQCKKIKLLGLAILILAVFSSCSSSETASHATSSSRTKYDSYKGLIMAGYQGWFNTPTDGAGRGWYHYNGQDGFKPGSCKIDMWADVSEYEKTYETEFRMADGSPAFTFSSHDESTVDTHFRWMQEYGIDGVFMQRFVGEIKGESGKMHFNKVLSSGMKAASKYDRAIAIMYDLSGMRSGDENVLIEDIKELAKEHNIKSRQLNKSYLFHNGKPLVTVWGVGFNDGRRYGLDEAETIINALRQEGFSIMLGVPTYWRELTRDTENDSRLHELIKKCDIILPWFVGRYDEKSYPAFADLIAKDMEWCNQNKIDYVPLCFPGFSWKNMKGADSSFIPRNRGSFLWTQMATAINSGAEMLYIAMFDEIDEATAIFKCATAVPVGASEFVPLDEDLGSDFYLRLVGEGRKMLRKELPFSPDIPI